MGNDENRLAQAPNDRSLITSSSCIMDASALIFESENVPMPG
jgi:hypothetical protein